MLRRLAFASTVTAALALTTALPAWAVPATDEGAAQITEALRRYLGPLPGVVETVPQGETYRLTLDAEPLVTRAVDVLVSAFAASDADDDSAPDLTDWTGISKGLRPVVAISPVVLTLTDRGDGRWDVAQDDHMTIRVSVGGLTLYDRSSQIRSQGVFDPELGTFSQFESAETGIRQIENQYLDFHEDARDSDGKPLPFTEAVTTTAESTSSGTAAANPEGGVDLRTNGALRTMLMQHKIYYSAPDENGRRDTFSIDASVSALTTEAEARGVRLRPMLDLLAWAVALPSLGDVPARQDELKPLIRAALPLFHEMRVTMPIDNLRVDTALLRGGFKRIDFAFDTTGLVRDGRVRFGLNLAGPDLPVMMLDPWMRPLVPDEAGIDVTMTGFDFATPIDMVLEALDLTAADPLATLDPDAAAAAVLRDGRIRFDIAPSLIQGKDYAIAFSGWAEGGPDDDVPQGKLTIEATGLDAVERQIEAGFGRRAEETLEILRAARSEAVRQDGKDVWVLDFAELEERYGSGAGAGDDSMTGDGMTEDGAWQTDPREGLQTDPQPDADDTDDAGSLMPSPPPPMPLPAPSPAPVRP